MIRSEIHNLLVFGVIPFVKLQNDTETTVKRLKTTKNEMRSEITSRFWLSNAVFVPAFFEAQKAAAERDRDGDKDIHADEKQKAAAARQGQRHTCR